MNQTKMNKIFNIEELQNHVINFLHYDDFKTVKMIDKNHYQTINNKLEEYSESVKCISNFALKNEVMDVELMTKKTTIRLYVRKYKEQWIDWIFEGGLIKIEHLLTEEQLNQINRINKENSKRIQMVDMLNILTKEQINYMGF
jgi:hypothetical protein